MSSAIAAISLSFFVLLYTVHLTFIRSASANLPSLRAFIISSTLLRDFPSFVITPPVLNSCFSTDCNSSLNSLASSASPTNVFNNPLADCSDMIVKFSFEVFDES